MSEKRVDPADGQAYTFDDLAAFYKGQMSKKAMLKFWENDCTPVKGKKGKAKAKPDAKAKAKAKAKPAPVAAAAEEKRVDPAYGEAYTYKELLAAYKGQFNKSECKAYWEDECKPVKGKKGAAKAKAKAKAAPVADDKPDPTEKRRDPEDGQVYTFAEWTAYYKEKLGKKFRMKASIGVWTKKCEPVGKKAKAKAKEKAAPKAKAKAKPEANGDEKRLDPAYKEAYTYKEMLLAYKGVYNKKECAAYWETLKPVKGKKAKGKAEAKAKAAPASDSPPGKRKDPADGKVYTFDALLKVYKEKLGKSFKKKNFLKYWEEKCYGKNGKPKAEAKAKAKVKAKAEPKSKKGDGKDKAGKTKDKKKGDGKTEKKGKGKGKDKEETKYVAKKVPMQLGYWQIRGLGAPCRMMLAYGGIEFKDTQYSWDGKGDWFGTDKPKLVDKNPLANLPYVVDGDRVVTQSNAVLNYIARKARVTGPPPARTDIDMILCDVYDLRDTFVNRMYWYKNVIRTVQEYDAMKKDYFSKQASPFYTKYEAWLTSRGKDFMTGPKPSVCDFHVWEMLDQHEIYAKDLGQESPLESKPKLKAYYERFRAMDKLKAYFESDAYKLPLNVPEFTFWSGPGSKPPSDAPKK